MRSALLIGSASVLAVVAGAIYIVDCRSWAKTQDETTGCYLTGLPIMGIGAAGQGGFRAGFNTYNPALRKEDEYVVGPPRAVDSETGSAPPNPQRSGKGFRPD